MGINLEDFKELQDATVDDLLGAAELFYAEINKDMALGLALARKIADKDGWEWVALKHLREYKDLIKNSD